MIESHNILISASMPADILYSNKSSIECIVSFLPNKITLENHLAQAIRSSLEYMDDPPETLHTPWGVWLHHWDALHSIDQKYDAEHMIRTGMVAEDIIHYYHYVPIIGEHERVPESYELSLEYDYSSQKEIYSLNQGLDEESVESPGIAADFNLETDFGELTKDIGVDKERDFEYDAGNICKDGIVSAAKEQKKSSQIKLDKKLAKLLEEISGFIEH